MRLSRTHLQNGLIVATAALFAGARFAMTDDVQVTAEPPASAVMEAPSDSTVAAAITATSDGETTTELRAALDAFTPSVKKLSHPRALEDAFRSYFAYKTSHPGSATKPLLYFVDYGLSSTTPRGYLFDMQKLSIVDGPFMVAHGRGSSPARDGVPTRFSNGYGSASSSLGLYVAQELYGFVGHTAGSTYSSIGLRLKGVSSGFNDNARARGVVAHGAPYVTATRAGRSEGCPAVDQARAKKLLPALANGGLVFLFAPNEQWMNNDPWLNG